MFPILIQIGEFTLHTYGLLLAAGFLLAVAWTMREARRTGISPDLVLDFSFYILVAALLGSRVFYVVGNLSEFQENPIDVFKFWRGGLVYYGGLIFALYVGFWFLRRHRLPFGKMADLVAPAIALGQAVGRLGCFSAGCCYGSPSAVLGAVTFQNPLALAPLGIPLHPTQLYESAATFAIFLTLASVRRRPRFQGRLFWYYLILYSIARFVIEFYRGDPRGWALEGVLSTSQAIAIPLVILGLVMILRQRKS